MTSDNATREKRNELRATLRQLFPRNHGQLLPALHYLQHQFGHLPGWAMEVVGWHLGIPASEIYGAATSYVELRIEEPGQHIIKVCTGLPCWSKGGREIAEAVSKKLGLHFDQTSSDHRVTFEKTACGFLCPMAPVVEMDHEWRGRVTPEGVIAMLDEVERA